MSIRRTVALSVAAALAALSCFIGCAVIVSTLLHVETLTQLDRLVSFGYLSFADSLEISDAGGPADFFFGGIGLVLLGSLLLTKVPSVERIARGVACALFLFLASCLVYACLHSRVGEVPDYLRSAPTAR
ncbi:hypothetical protein WJ32_29070 [Burkholderia ubonensis]|uniref:hypothetical protein n=1 Tax=Burkholderia ubonensis TaxID=101571 RepID=UPI00075AE154|nr:hypothetical protein [Burkholderia ubonensis]AOJ66425.1 hypothetical protein WJ32_29070 [Burkholderia ubonensis]